MAESHFPAILHAGGGSIVIHKGNAPPALRGSVPSADEPPPRPSTFGSSPMGRVCLPAFPQDLRRILRHHRVDVEPGPALEPRGLRQAGRDLEVPVVPRLLPVAR